MERATDRRLERVRSELAGLDRSLLLLAAARLETAQRAIRLRMDRGGKPRDPAQEQVVLTRARRWGEELGLSGELVDRLFVALLSAGREPFEVAGSPWKPVVGSPVRVLAEVPVGSDDGTDPQARTVARPPQRAVRRLR